MPGTIVVPPASTTSQPGGSGPSSPEGLIQEIRPPDTSTLIPTDSCADRPSASAASR